MFQYSKMSTSFIGGMSVVTFSCYLIQRWFNAEVKERAMDEMAHLNMTEQYIVERDFSRYASAITTPPGLYYVGMIYGWGLQFLSGNPSLWENKQDINNLRYLNSMFIGTANLYLLWKIFKAKGSGDSVFQALNGYLMPLNFTVMFLYYTETASLNTLLLLYYRIVLAKDGAHGPFSG
jgi:hypothetical protein